MSKVWRAVLTVAAVLLAAGVIMAAVGYITGASPNRMAELVFGGADRMWTAFRQALDRALGIFGF